MKTFLAYGAGIDSTAILCQILNNERSRPDAVVFADPGAEFPATYETVELAMAKCKAIGLPFVIVRHGTDSILTWMERNGTVPVMPGGPHVCSLKFKGEPMQKWAVSTYPGQSITWLVGIEPDEKRRAQRFTPPKGSIHSFHYPLIEDNITRTECAEIVQKHWGAPVRKSSCYFCPFMKKAEIAEIIDTPLWETVKEIEQRFAATSPIKHKKWNDAGQPLCGSRAPVGMWRRDSWAEGSRLFTQKLNGKQLSAAEWEAEITDPAQGCLFDVSEAEADAA